MSSRLSTLRLRILLLLMTAAWLAAAPASAQFCVGDCNDDSAISISELGIGIEIALGNEALLEGCDVFDDDLDGAVSVDELVLGVNNAGNACAGPAWQFQNPAPVGDDLFAVSFINPQTGWAVGAFGNVLSTTDAGTTWDVGFIDSQVNLFGVKFLDAVRGWTVGDFGFVFRTTNGGDSWTEQESNATTALNAVTFLDANVGWLIGVGGVIRHTSNGGDTWITQASPRNVSLNAQHFIDAQNGWIVGDQGAILRTTNGGQQWTSQPSTTTRSLYGVFFIDASRGIAVGDEGVVLRTDNGGMSWMLTQPSGLVDVPVGTTPLLSVHFVDANNGWIVGDIDLDEAGTGQGVILRTSDGGNSWVRQETANDNAFFAVTFSGPNGYAVGSSGTLLRTLDGVNWTLQNSGPTNVLFGVSFTAGGTHGYAVGDLGAVGRTTDGGETWVSRNYVELEGLYAVSSVQVDNSAEFGDWAWVAGGNGTVLFTRSGGIAWERQNTPTDIADLPLFGIKFVDASNGWAVGLDGVIIHTSNGGFTWSRQVSNSPDCDGFPCSLNAVAFVDAQTGIVGGDAGVILRTTNGGNTWTQQNSGTGDPIFGVACANAQNCWAVGGFADETETTQVIRHTTNGGATWTGQTAPSIALAQLFAVTATDTQHAWAVGDTGIIIGTTNGGTTWEFQESGTDALLNALSFSDSQNGWVVGDGGLVLNTSTGGQEP